MSHRWPFILGCTALFTVGCHKDAALPVTEASPTPPPIAKGAVTPTESAAAPIAEADLSAVLAELTQVVRKYSFEQKRLPASFDELVTAGYLAGPPTAPTGRKFSIDPKTMQVVVVKL